MMPNSEVNKNTNQYWVKNDENPNQLTWKIM
jgi:hypothetical protein